MIYDLIVIGGGPAGYLAAERAGRAGLSVMLAEKRFIGGVCLNEGCIPTKTLLYSAKICDGIKYGEKYGVTADNIRLDHRVVTTRKNKVVKKLVAGVRSMLQKDNVTVVEGVAAIRGRDEESFFIDIGGTGYRGMRLLVATGSVPLIPPIPGIREGIDSGYILTNSGILDLEEVPRSLVVVGGGIIGLEMASYFNSARSRVTVVEMLDRIAGNTDREISEILMKNYREKGVEFRLESRVTEIRGDSVIYETGGQQFSAASDKVLVSIGRKPATEGLGLENIGVELERGRIKTDERGRTNIPEVYAAGDVNGVSMLAHTAYREAEVVINTIIGKRDTMRYDAIPSVIYTNPEVASVGETEESARAKGIDFEAVKLSMMYSGRYAAENEGGDGICKVLIDKRHRKIIGVHMIGNYSSEIIYGAGLLIETEMRVDDIRELVFPHPTVSEIIREAIFEY